MISSAQADAAAEAAGSSVATGVATSCLDVGLHPTKDHGSASGVLPDASAVAAKRQSHQRGLKLVRTIICLIGMISATFARIMRLESVPTVVCTIAAPTRTTPR